MWAICVHPYGGGRFSEDNGRSALGRMVLTQPSSLGAVIDRQPQRRTRTLMVGSPGWLRPGSGLLPEAPGLAPSPTKLLSPSVILQHLTLTHHLPVLDICLASWPRVLKFITSIYWKMYSLCTVKPSPFPCAFSNQVFRYLSCFSHFLLFFLVHGMFRFLASSLPCSSLPCFSIAAPL